jgi:predicted TPR repeat methyltransferase
MDEISTLESANNFAQYYDDYIQNCNWVGTDILFGLMYEYIYPGQTILDIGIGTGLSSKLFKALGLTIYGIDFAEEMIKVSRSKGFTEELKLVDLTKNDAWFENKIFNHALSQGVFHLIGELENVFKQTALIINENGYFGFTYESVRDSLDDFKETSTIGLYEHKNEQSGIKAYRHTDKYIFDLLETNGFQLNKKTEFLAFVDSNTKVKTYFNVIVAKKK